MRTRKLEVRELKNVTGGVGPVHEIPGMKYLPKRIPVRAKKLQGRF